MARMSASPHTQGSPDLGARLEALGRALGSREAEHAVALEVAHSRLGRLHARVVEAFERFHAAAEELEAALADFLAHFAEEAAAP